ncbi:DUF559 domain-containing protein [Microtetraspora sp. NBRC 16547]|uniref:endonuclease domain-containing protein n=1 Tax=Microtetraspora sp. NBRC 16547 TaxID=3030993 RepID=UPI0024A59D7A|nr:DUF559 domain-containing protein [Microtetraspora sp. NBRC 16547]GLX00616.1 hypothetical protein Misp02_47020 [Microtetraspora sp. NBRC 16547]
MEALTLSIEPLPDDAPAIVTYFPSEARSTADMVASMLSAMETAALGLFPAWLPEAAGIGGPGGAGARAVRSLALRAAPATGHFGPFLADLAELSVRRAASAVGGVPPRLGARFTPEVRATGLARVLAAGFHRAHASILVAVPPGLSPVAEEILVGACEWLAQRGGLGVWLAGAPLAAVDRLETRTVRLFSPEYGDVAAGDATRPPARLQGGHGQASERTDGSETTSGSTPVAGRPHPGSVVEQILERALSSCAWAAGRAWNQSYQSHPLVNPIRVDLLWREERCAVEIDGSDHRGSAKYERDRQRDIRLQTDGYAVLRFTNEQIMSDPKSVLSQIERFLRARRHGKHGSPHGIPKG